MRDILSSLKLEVDIVAITIKIEDNIISGNMSGIQGNLNIDEPNIINLSLDNCNLYIEKNNNL